MRKQIIAFSLVLCSLSALAQKENELWIMTYVKVLQPVYTMVDNNGSFEIDDSAPQDSSFLYNSGLMTFKFQAQNKAISHSWDGQERWTFDLDKEDIQLYGPRDTLFGKVDNGQIILSSTLDDRPTFYHFEKLDVKSLSTSRLIESKYTAKIENHILSNNQIAFTTDSTQAVVNKSEALSKVFFTYNLEGISAFEFDFYPEPGTGFEQELGTVYVFQDQKNVIKGIFFPIYDGLEEPKRKYVTFSPQGK
ncbi:hypothetical protein [Roseivirga misakiensis]|uniref:Uncharacterized protein n=1 Tax=Roseivirga misakiensis TaxID=1563681 RepID=A0A1E5T6D5_9BACT|nr:hypothetical protein [Roseivirga misakiensis]OEK06941.1 hypothetical protein BFP71_04605 [Roseivirga misakiensis]